MIRYFAENFLIIESAKISDLISLGERIVLSTPPKINKSNKTLNN